MRAATISSIALALYLLSSSMSYHDEIRQEQINCEYWPEVFDYCRDREHRTLKFKPTKSGGLL